MSLVTPTPVDYYDMLPALSQQNGISGNQTDAKFNLIDQLMKEADPVVMESLVHKITRNPDGGGPISRFFTSAPIPIPNSLNNAISQLEPGVFQDVVFIRILNGLRLLDMKCFNEFRYSLEMAQTSIQTRISDHQRQVPVNRRSTTMNALTKLDKMIGWEILLGDILRAFLNWGGPEVLCVDELVERCQNCIKIFQSSRSDVRPRPDVVEAALMALINLGKFELVVNCSKTQQGWPFLEFFVLLGRICINVQNEAYYSSNFRDVWNAILPILSVNTGVKRQPQAEGIVANITTFKWLLERAKSRNLVKIFVSLLVKLHNLVTQDDSGFTIEVELLDQWPNFLDEVCDGPSTGFSSARKVAGTSKLNLVLIRELLVNFLETQGGPDHLMWLKTAGHIHLVAKSPFMAMKSYVSYLSQSTDFFESEGSAWNDDLLITRMIRASYLLGAFLQATILCQFLTVSDYNTAFGMASEATSTEAWASMVEFIWDQTILEYLVNFYSRRKDYGCRLNAAMNVIRQLELNAHNNQEIKTAAIRIRKVQFLRSLVSIYLMD